ncbi:HEPN domain-containing protein [Candidatus Woesearchaeota archaeon]|nr:HEPN domain-containing protein [Candidatus Woesearchaeota archaeon]
MRIRLSGVLRKEKKAKGTRDLKEINSDVEKSNKHIEKANHNFKAMIYLIKGNFPDRAVSASFYSMYHCLLAVLAKHGYESRNQECTFAAVEHLIKNKKADLDIQLLRKIASFEENLEAEDIVTLREEFQYGTEAVVDDAKMKELQNSTREFIEIARAALKK